MRKVLIITFLLVLGVSVLYSLLKNYYHVDPEAIINQVKPPSKDIIKLLPQGSDLNSPLNIPEGFRMAVFADVRKIGSPRVLAFDSNGTLFASIPSAGKVLALPDKNRDGIADALVEIIASLNSPHGIDFAGDKIFIAETDKVVRYDYDSSKIKLQNPKVLFSLSGGGRHFTRTIKILEDKIYTSVGSSCDTCQEKDWQRASILVSNLDGGDLKVFAKGLRNTVFFVFDNSGRIWGNEMGRDFLGDNLPPDELNVIETESPSTTLRTMDYGWPWCYGDRIRDTKFRGSESLDFCSKTVPSVFNYPAHIAPLGLTFIDSDLFSKEDQGSLLSAFHGSWNSSVPVGYKIVKLEVDEGKVTGMEDFITGFIKGKEILGRPVDLIFDKDGVLFISDDKADLIYILTKELKS
ncbi:MAG: L-sorbosone dehydrogenase [Candidatus Woesebacteria bacterium GW2011_GWB1_39_12]|uniref:L-sorbosone dehydrogenase n=2 Tax=Candidatus Woeseibacteriota TaxID=1752722 RepID=A0A0G0M5G4_9BACT|nr:MAG: L-sorbosone dehydrogenase [Candidatus Woesebacteria bacterium GW2011_GWA1_39_12]KKR00972.1 MAG: L-sorbosone dehydrogenase [Candidatus Woesebacteria bacterium GW2011_GWB1_39_12]